VATVTGLASTFVPPSKGEWCVLHGDRQPSASGNSLVVGLDRKACIRFEASLNIPFHLGGGVSVGGPRHSLLLGCSSDTDHRINIGCDHESGRAPIGGSKLTLTGFRTQVNFFHRWGSTRPTVGRVLCVLHPQVRCHREPVRRALTPRPTTCAPPSSRKSHLTERPTMSQAITSLHRHTRTLFTRMNGAVLAGAGSSLHHPFIHIGCFQDHIPSSFVPHSSYRLG